MKRMIGAAVTALATLVSPAGAQERGTQEQGSQLTTIEQRELDQLHQQLMDLERRNARLQAEVDALRRQVGVGGGGSGTGGAAAGGTGAGATGKATAERGGAAPGPAAQGQGTRGVAIATATFEGTVLEVTPRRISVLDEEGLRYDLVVDPQTEALQNGRPVPIEQIPEGAPVRATFDLISGADHATRIEVLPGE